MTGEPLIRRFDDNVDTLRGRLQTYHRHTAPLIDYYSMKGLHRRIDAARSPDDVFKAVVDALEAGRKKK